jgi:hypothetical protein
VAIRGRSAPVAGARYDPLLRRRNTGGRRQPLAAYTRLIDDASTSRMTAAIIAALAGPRPNRATTIRAHAAFAVAKEATLAAMAIGNGRLTPGDRDEILAAAQRALHAAPLPQA